MVDVHSQITSSRVKMRSTSLPLSSLLAPDNHLFIVLFLQNTMLMANTGNIFQSLHPASFNMHSPFEIHTYHCSHQYFIYLYWWRVLNCVDAPFIHSNIKGILIMKSYFTVLRRFVTNHVGAHMGIWQVGGESREIRSTRWLWATDQDFVSKKMKISLPEQICLFRPVFEPPVLFWIFLIFCYHLFNFSYYWEL